MKILISKSQLLHQYCSMWGPGSCHFTSMPGHSRHTKVWKPSMQSTFSFLRDMKLLVWTVWSSNSITVVLAVLYYFGVPEDVTIWMANFGDLQEGTVCQVIDDWEAVWEETIGQDVHNLQWTWGLYLRLFISNNYSHKSFECSARCWTVQCVPYMLTHSSPQSNLAKQELSSSPSERCENHSSWRLSNLF